MSMFNDQWVTMAMADDTLVADQLLLFRHHRPSLLPHWARRQRRTPRLPATAAQTVRASPTTPLTWTAATSLDGYDGPTRKTAPPPTHSSGSKAMDKSETFLILDKSETAATKKRFWSKRNLGDLKREQKLTLKENKDLKNKLAAVNLTDEKNRARAEILKKMKLDFTSRGTLENVQAVLEPPQSVEAQCDPPNLGSDQTVENQIQEDKPVEDESPICSAASAPSIGGQEPPLLLPDLNQPPEEYLTEFL